MTLALGPAQSPAMSGLFYPEQPEKLGTDHRLASARSLDTARSLDMARSLDSESSLDLTRGHLRINGGCPARLTTYKRGGKQLQVHIGQRL